jgi:hypothetical protein
MAAARHPLRSHIVTLFRRGELVSVREAVLICDASRQAVNRWLRQAGIDLVSTRLRYIARHRDRARRIEEGRPPRRGPTKAELRKQGEKAVVDFNQRQDRADLPQPPRRSDP